MLIQGSYPYLYGQRCGDINGDGKTDIVQIRASDNAVFFRLSDGTGFGTLHSAGTLGDQYGQYLVADVTGDGKADLLFFRFGTVTIRKSTGTGFASPTTFATGFGDDFYTGGSFQALDFNGDGKSDIMYVDFPDQTVNVRLSTGSGLGATTYSKAFGDVAGEYFTGDFNGDGKDDILCANRPTQTLDNPSVLQPHTVSMVLSTGTGFGATSQVVCGDCFGHISWGGKYLSADFNKDGKDDILFFSPTGGVSGGGTMYVILSTGTGLGTFIGPANFSIMGSQILVGDINGDGKADVISPVRVDDSMWMMLSNGTSFGSPRAAIAQGSMGSLNSGDQYF